MVSAIQERIDNGLTLSNIKTLGLDALTGMIRFYFEFSKSTGGINLSPDNVLVLMNHLGEVVGVVAPFDPDHPNPLAPPFGEVADKPFALARPSVTERIKVTAEDLKPREVRTRRFLSNIQDAGGVEEQGPQTPGGPCLTNSPVWTAGPPSNECIDWKGIWPPTMRCDHWAPREDQIDWVSDDDWCPPTM